MLVLFSLVWQERGDWLGPVLDVSISSDSSFEFNYSLGMKFTSPAQSLGIQALCRGAGDVIIPPPPTQGQDVGLLHRQAPIPAHRIIAEALIHWVRRIWGPVNLHNLRSADTTWPPPLVVFNSGVCGPSPEMCHVCTHCAEVVQNILHQEWTSPREVCFQKRLKLNSSRYICFR